MVSPARRIGLVTALLAGLWLALELTRAPHSLQPATGDTQPVADEIKIPDLSVEPPLLAEFKATLERPLFNQDRRPEEEDADAEDSVAEVVAPGAAPNLRLSAVIVDEEGRSALLEVTGQAQTQRVAEGGEIAGWRLEEVRDDRVVLTAGDRRTELALRVFEPPKPVRPVRKRQVVPRRPGAVVPSRRVVPPPANSAEERPSDEAPPDELPPDAIPPDASPRVAR